MGSDGGTGIFMYGGWGRDTLERWPPSRWVWRRPLTQLTCLFFCVLLEPQESMYTTVRYIISA